MIADVFDKTIINYHIGLTAKASDAARVIKNAVTKRNIKKSDGRIVRTGKKHLRKQWSPWGGIQERIQVNTPNMNTYIESFHNILKDECYSYHEFETFAGLTWFRRFLRNCRPLKALIRSSRVL